ncbi:MAG: ParA family protein [Candidatus Omnitrophica bacterium]|nr:ParA family protein [Candidatus Omnitrophota bacterium]
MGRVITICNQKGGVGKTTTAINLSTYLAYAGQNVLLIDIDPQANATSGLGFEKEKVGQSIYQTLVGDLELKSAVRDTVVPNLSLIPSHPDLAGAEVELIYLEKREFRLREKLRNLLSEYDLVFIDCPPSLSLLTVNAIVACDSVLIPLQCEYYALEGLSQLLKTIGLIKKRFNLQIEIEGILLTMSDARTSLSEQVIRDVREHMGDRVFRQEIPRSVRLSEAPSFGRPVLLHDSRSRGALAYKDLASEFLSRRLELSTKLF